MCTIIVIIWYKKRCVLYYIFICVLYVGVRVAELGWLYCMSEAEGRGRVYVGVRVAELGWLYCMSEAEGRGRVYVVVRVAELGWLYCMSEE